MQNQWDEKQILNLKVHLREVTEVSSYLMWNGNISCSILRESHHHLHCERSSNKRQSGSRYGALLIHSAIALTIFCSNDVIAEVATQRTVCQTLI